MGHRKLLIIMVGVRGFEPPAPASRRQCSTRLSYTPTGRCYPAKGAYFIEGPGVLEAIRGGKEKSFFCANKFVQGRVVLEFIMNNRTLATV